MESGFLTREALLGASDLKEETVELPSIGGKVKIQSLAAAYANEATSESIELTTDQRGRQTSTVNTVKLEALKVQHALLEPKLNSLEDAYTLSKQIGPAWQTLVMAIDRISGITQEQVKETAAMFPGGGDGEERTSPSNGVAAVRDGSDLPVRVGD